MGFFKDYKYSQYVVIDRSKHFTYGDQLVVLSNNHILTTKLNFSSKLEFKPSVSIFGVDAKDQERKILFQEGVTLSDLNYHAINVVNKNKCIPQEDFNSVKLFSNLNSSTIFSQQVQDRNLFEDVMNVVSSDLTKVTQPNIYSVANQVSLALIFICLVIKIFNPKIVNFISTRLKKICEYHLYLFYAICINNLLKFNVLKSMTTFAIVLAINCIVGGISVYDINNIIQGILCEILLERLGVKEKGLLAKTIEQNTTSSFFLKLFENILKIISYYLTKVTQPNIYLASYHVSLTLILIYIIINIFDSKVVNSIFTIFIERCRMIKFFINNNLKQISNNIYGKLKRIKMLSFCFIARQAFRLKKICEHHLYSFYAICLSNILKFNVLKSIVIFAMVLGINCILGGVSAYDINYIGKGILYEIFLEQLVIKEESFLAEAIKQNTTFSFSKKLFKKLLELFHL